MTEAGTNDTLHVHVAPDGAIVASGDIDVAGGPLLEAVILDQEAQSGATAAIVIDLADVTFIDSSGLRSLLSASRRADERAATVVLRSPSPSVQRLLEITGTTSQFRIEAGVSQTTAVLGGPVVVQVPAEASMARLVRLTASSLAAMAGMDVDDIEDVKIVVSEVMAALIEHGDGPDITIKLELESERLTISGFTDSAVFVADSTELALSATVLAAIAEQHAIEHADGRLLIVASYATASTADVPDA